MDDVLDKYNTSRFEECLHSLKKQTEKDEGLVENLIKQNCIEVCQCLVLISRGDSSKAVDTLRSLYRNYQNAIAPGLPGVIIPLQLELTSLFNFVWWGLFYVNLESIEGADKRGYLPCIQRGLRRVLGISCKVNNYVSITEDILYDVRNAGKNLQIIDYSTTCLLAEVLVLTLLYVLKEDNSTDTVVKCLETVTTILDDMEKLIIGLTAVREFEDPSPLYGKLFKFGFDKINSTVSHINTTAISSLYIIKSLCFFLLKKYENVLLVMKKNLKSEMKPLWCYIGGLSTLMLGDYNQCMGFVVMSKGLRFDNGLKSRFNILHGQLLSKKEDYKEALKCFIEAKRISPGIAATYYYMGEEYGKMGLSNDMVDCFKDTIKIIEGKTHQKVSCFTTTVESVVLDLLHPADEIAESEATYAGAVACGLIERYQESTDMFEKYIEIGNVEEDSRVQDRIIKTPGLVTILHEAATMNILTGNFSRAEYLLSQAVNHYAKLEDPIAAPKKDVHITKDARWLRTLLHEELGINGGVSDEKDSSIDLFSEEIVYFFEEDLIALMLSAEMESKVDDGACKVTLGKLISIFLKYCAQMQKNAESVREQEKIRWTLVKALSGRTCLMAANYQLKGKTSGVEIERMFKRALSCNQGDKDILYGYCKFLLGDGKTSDAKKLWRTFHGKEPVVVVDQCQSLALRYLLRTQVTKREWEKLEMDLNSSAMDVDFQL